MTDTEAKDFVLSQNRLRVLDIACRWFWFVVFWYGPRYGESKLEAHLYDGPSWTRGWFHVWKRESSSSAPAPGGETPDE